MSQDKYNRVAIILHWVLALALIAQFGFGLWMEEIEQKKLKKHILNLIQTSIVILL